MPRKGDTRIRDSIDVLDVIARTARGETDREIALAIGRSLGCLHDAINAAQPDVRSAHAAARAASAEALLDLGLAVVQSALHKSGDIDPSAARAVAQEYARRAAIRNPAYREQKGVAVDLSGVIKVTTATDMTDAQLAEIAGRA